MCDFLTLPIWECSPKIESINLRVSPLLALVVQEVTVASRGPGELGTAVGAGRLGRLARLLALVS